MKKLLILLMGFILIIALTGCGFEEAKSELDRKTDPQVTVNELDLFVDDNSAFAFDLYHELKDRDDNLLFSPYSLSTSMAMTYAGARGETEKEIAEVFHFGLPQERLHPAFNTLDTMLSERTGKTEDLRLDIHNAVWGQEGYDFLADYLDILATNYGAGIKLVDYINSPDNARRIINNLVSKQTDNRIEDLIPAGDIINTLTRLVLTNTVYFSAEWEYKFLEPRYSKNHPFYLKDGTEIVVPMMRTDFQSFNYTRIGICQAVELPYQGEKISMLVLVADSGNFDELEESMDIFFVNQIIDEMEINRVILEMPRFSFESGLLLKTTLSKMGMTGAFGGGTDFSGMTGTNELFIEDVVHKSWISVDEEGTEAASASAVVAMVGLEEAVYITIDRPFIFLIRDIESGTIVFLGRVLNPLES
jgi:serpin B